MTGTALRAGLYERVSTGIQDTELSRSVDQQNRQGQAAVRQHGWRVAARYADPGLSASRYARKGRPDWTRLVADIESGRLDIIVMWASDRGGRELEAWARFLMRAGSIAYDFCQRGAALRPGYSARLESARRGWRE